MHVIAVNFLSYGFCKGAIFYPHLIICTSLSAFYHPHFIFRIWSSKFCIRILSSAFYHPHLIIRILTSAFYHPHFIILILTSAFWHLCILSSSLSSAFYHPHFNIRILSSAFYHPHFELSSSFYHPHSTIRICPQRTLLTFTYKTNLSKFLNYTWRIKELGWNTVYLHQLL